MNFIKIKTNDGKYKMLNVHTIESIGEVLHTRGTQAWAGITTRSGNYHCVVGCKFNREKEWRAIVSFEDIISLTEEISKF